MSSNAYKVFVLLTVLGCCIESASSAAYASPEKNIALGQQYFMRKRYAAALEMYNQAIKEDPKSVDAYYGRVVSLVEGNMELKALPDCNKVIELAPKKFPEIYMYRALAERQMEEPAKVVADCTTALKLGATSENLYHMRAGANRDLGQYQNAIDDFTLLIERHKKQPQPITNQVYEGRGELYEAQGKIDKAIADYLEARRINPRNEESYTQMARLHDRLGQTSKSVEDYTAFLKYYPEDAQGWAERGRFNFKLKRYSDSVADLTKAINLEPAGYSKLYDARADAYTKLGKADLAAKDRMTAHEMMR